MAKDNRENRMKKEKSERPANAPRCAERWRERKERIERWVLGGRDASGVSTRSVASVASRSASVEAGFSQQERRGRGRKPGMVCRGGRRRKRVTNKVC